MRKSSSEFGFAARGGRLKFDFHAGAAYWRGGGSSADEVFDCAVVLAWFALAALAVMAWQDKVKGDD